MAATVTLDLAKVDAAAAEIRGVFKSYNARIAKFSDSDPSHWRPNVTSARNWTMNRIASDLLDAHFEGRRFRGASLASRRATLMAQIEATDVWQALLAHIGTREPGSLN